MCIVVLLHGLQVVEVAARTGVALWLGQGAASFGIGPDFSIRVGIILGVVQCCGHFQHLRHGRIGKSTARQLGDDLDHGHGLVQLALGHQHFGHQSRQAFCDRHGTVQGVCIKAAVIAFIDNTAFVHHQKSVGVICAKRLIPCHRITATKRCECHTVYTSVRISGQGTDAVIATAHGDRRHQLAKVAHSPAQFREGEVIRVGKADRFVRRRGNPASSPW